MRKLLLLSFVLTSWVISIAQQTPALPGSPAKNDSLRMARIIPLLQFPLFSGTPFCGILPVENVSEKPDPAIQYKILFELTYVNPDSQSGQPNNGLVEVERILNLHVASGIPADHLIPIIVVHGKALFAFLTDEKYKQKYHGPNPNIQVIKNMERLLHCKFIACGQAMGFHEISHTDLLPDMKISLTAQTVISGYQLKGYVWEKINPDE